tara:strand:+ start:314 stop:1072 length:759 start_codon:yes stop_codon:yes gene_type:complete
MKISATIQARMGSTRLPGKVMLPIDSRPLIQIQVESLRKSKYLNSIIVAMTTNKLDDKLYKFCKHKLKVNVYRGNEKDVLQRICSALKKNNVDLNVECFADSPLIDHTLIDQFILKYKKSNYDVVTNTLKRTYPAGQEITIYKTNKLNILNKLVKKKDPLREHVSFNFYRFKKKFSIYNKLAPKKYHYPNLYLEVDSKKDFIFLQKIIKELKVLNKNLNLINIIKFIKRNKKLLNINKKVERKWKEVYKKNL